MSNHTTAEQGGSLPDFIEDKSGASIDKVEATIAEYVRPLLMKACQQSCREVDWPESMVTETLADSLAADVAAELGITPKRIARAVSRCSQPPHILRVLRAGAATRRKTPRGGA